MLVTQGVGVTGVNSFAKFTGVRFKVDSSFLELTILIHAIKPMIHTIYTENNKKY